MCDCLFERKEKGRAALIMYVRTYVRSTRRVYPQWAQQIVAASYRASWRAAAAGEEEKEQYSSREQLSHMY